MTVKVTFDTNVFNLLVDPYKIKRDNPIYYFKIVEAIENNVIKGFFSDTFITLEGVMKFSRSDVFGSRKIDTVMYPGTTPNSISISIGASMQKTKINDVHKKKVTNILNLGLRALRGNLYLGDNFLPTLDCDIYDSIAIDEWIKISERMQRIEIAIAKKNKESSKDVGKCRARNLGLKLLGPKNKSKKVWYEGLSLCEDKKEVNSAVAEWADGESVIRHFGYTNDYFCTLDEGKGGNKASILDKEHKEWLSCEFGLKFVKPKELVEIIYQGLDKIDLTAFICLK